MPNRFFVAAPSIGKASVKKIEEVSTRKFYGELDMCRMDLFIRSVTNVELSAKPSFPSRRIVSLTLLRCVALFLFYFSLFTFYRIDTVDRILSAELGEPFPLLILILYFVFLLNTVLPTVLRFFKNKKTELRQCVRILFSFYFGVK